MQDQGHKKELLALYDTLSIGKRDKKEKKQNEQKTRVAW